MASGAEWQLGYARQARADFDVFQRIQSEMEGAAECHKLLFLQMACEKLVKAHLCANNADPQTLQSSHAFVAGKLPAVLRQQATCINFVGAAAKAVLKHAKHIAQEIELLAPAVKRGGQRPDNCEYPWEDAGGTLHVPLDWTFYPSRLLVERGGRTVLKLISGAIDRLLE